MIAPNTLYPKDEIVPALRELFSQRPATTSAGPEMLAYMLYMLRYTNLRPCLFEVEAALEALRVGEEVAA